MMKGSCAQRHLTERSDQCHRRLLTDRQHASLGGVAETLEDGRECLCPF